MTPTVDHEGNGTPAGCDDIAFASLDGTALRGRLWARSDPRATLVISHGLGEHGGSYHRTALELGAKLGLDVLAFDFRGSGEERGPARVVRDYADLSLDLAAALAWMSNRRPNLPRFLLGHSNGGLVALRTVLDRALGLSGLIVSNPSIRLTAHVPVWKRFAAEILLRVAPGITLATGLTNDQLTRDAEVIAEIDADIPRHNRISPPLYFGMSASGPIILARAAEFRVPILMILGGSDPIIDPESGRLFFERLGSTDKTLKVYPDMRHEPLNESGRAEVLTDLATWIGHRLG